jgi:CPA2 family monovalent cation:H+ antiporter-2
MSTGPQHERTITGVYEDGRVRLTEPVGWAEGTRLALRVERAERPEPGRGEVSGREIGRVVVAGFGPPGRWVGEALERHHIQFALIDLNPGTIARQRELGREAIQGSVTDPAVLKAAGIAGASILLLTIPDEQAVIEATRVARQFNPDLHIVARTTHTSAGLAARQAGADEVIKAEQAVARRFYEHVISKIEEGT